MDLTLRETSQLGSVPSSERPIKITATKESVLPEEPARQKEGDGAPGVGGVCCDEFLGRNLDPMPKIVVKMAISGPTVPFRGRRFVVSLWVWRGIKHTTMTASS